MPGACHGSRVTRLGPATGRALPAVIVTHRRAAITVRVSDPITVTTPRRSPRSELRKLPSSSQVEPLNSPNRRKYQ
eukprot:22056-Hanusia_phi.AAC.1